MTADCRRKGVRITVRYSGLPVLLHFLISSAVVLEHISTLWWVVLTSLKPPLNIFLSDRLSGNLDGGWRQALLSGADAGAPLHFLFQPDLPLQLSVFVGHIQLTFKHLQIYLALFSGVGVGSLAFHFSPRPSQKIWLTNSLLEIFLINEDLFSSS